MAETQSNPEVYVKINECRALPPDRLIVNLDVATFRDNMPDPNRAVMIQLDRETRKIITDESGTSKNNDLVFRAVNDIRNKLRIWAKGAESSASEYEISIPSVDEDTSPEDAATEEAELEYELITAREKLKEAEERLRRAKRLEGQLREKAEEIQDRHDDLSGQYRSISSDVDRDSSEASGEALTILVFGQLLENGDFDKKELRKAGEVAQAGVSEAKQKFFSKREEREQRKKEKEKLEQELEKTEKVLRDYKNAQAECVIIEKKRHKKFIEVARLEKLLASRK